MRILTVGDDALLLEFADGSPVEDWHAELWRRREQGEFRAQEIVAGARTVLVDGCEDASRLCVRLPDWSPRTGSTSARRAVVELAVDYDGDDLEWVASHLGRSVDDFVTWHLGTEFHVAFCGFAPGFAYMTGLGVTVPRLTTPRARVPAGAVGLADTYCGIYPTASPGGWRLIGRTTAVLFDPERAAPALLTPGTRVRFTRDNS